MTKKDQFPPQHQNKQPGREYKMNPKPDFEKEDLLCRRLEGRVAIITGGDSGIGRATAVRFAQEGADVAIVYLEEDTDARETQKQVEEEGKRCLLLKGDLRNESFSQKITDQVLSDFKHIDILINNAAYQEEQTDFLNITSDQLKKTFETNIYAFFI